MKKLYLLLTIFIFYSAGLFAQDCNPFVLTKFPCDAEVICDLNELDGSCWEFGDHNEFYTTPGDAGCTVDNPHWFSFIAQDNHLVLKFTAGDCDENNGVQFIIYEGEPECDFGNVRYLKVVDGMPENSGCEIYRSDKGPHILNVNLEKYHQYYILMDPYGSQKCQVDIEVLSGIDPDFNSNFEEPPQQAELITPEFSSPNTLCSGASEITICLQEMDEKATHWMLETSTGISQISKTTEECITLEDNYDENFQVCASFLSTCDTSDTQCMNITVSEDYYGIEFYDTICQYRDYFYLDRTINTRTLVQGDYTFELEVSRTPGCAVTDTLYLHIEDGVPIRYETRPDYICSGLTELSMNRDAYGQWIVRSGPGNVKFSHPSYHRSVVEVDVSGKYVIEFVPEKKYCIEQEPLEIYFQTGSTSVDFTIDNNGLEYTFSTEFIDSVLYLWDFGDGSRDTGHIVSHTFSSSDAIHEVTLDAISLCRTNSHKEYITIGNPPNGSCDYPIKTYTYPQNPKCDEEFSSNCLIMEDNSVSYPYEYAPSCFAHDPNWFSFIADSSAMSIKLDIYNCSSEQGVQVALLTGEVGPDHGVFDNLTEVVGVIDFCAQLGPTNRSGYHELIFSADVGEKYFILIDGWQGDLCSIDFIINDGKRKGLDISSDPEIFVDLPEFQGPDTVCLGSQTLRLQYDTLSEVVRQIQVRTDEGTQTVDAGRTYIDIDYNFDTPGTEIICTRFLNLCDTTAYVCDTVIVAIPENRLVYDTICQGVNYQYELSEFETEDLTVGDYVLIDTVTTFSECMRIDTINLTVVEPIQFAIEEGDRVVCHPVISLSIDKDLDGVWSGHSDIGVEPIIKTSDSTTTLVTLPVQGEYTFYFTAETYQCGNVDTVHITLLSKPHANFLYTVNGNEVIFEPHGLYWDEVEWDFDDGSNSTDTSTFVHTYPNENDIYYVTMIVSNFCGNDTIRKPIEIFKTSQVAEQSLGLALFPNPTQDQFSVISSQNIIIKDITIFNLNGQEIRKFQGLESSRVTQDVTFLNSGLYMVTVRTEQGTRNFKLVKM